MPVAQPPFHADHVGSLLRPDYLVAARQKFLAGALTKDALQPIEDRAIREVVAMQEELGLRVVTDGEFGHNSYLTGFLNPIGVDLQQHKSDDLVYHDDAHGTTLVPGTKAFVTRRDKMAGLGAGRRVQIPQGNHPADAKGDFAGADASAFLFRQRRHQQIRLPRYREFWDESLAPMSRSSKRSARPAAPMCRSTRPACRNSPIPQIQEVVAQHGQDWRALLQKYAAVINRILAGAPAGMHIAIHHCRGNNAGLWQAQAGYDAVAEIISARSTRKPISSNTIRPAPAISRRCVSCRKANSRCSA